MGLINILKRLQEEGLHAVIFDLDGVLIDSMKYHAYAWQEAFRKCQIEIAEGDAYELEGAKSEDTVRILYRKYTGRKPEEHLVRIVIETKEGIYRREFKLEVIDGASELVSALKQKGLKLGLVTGSTELGEVFAGKKGFLEDFDAICLEMDQD